MRVAAGHLGGAALNLGACGGGDAIQDRERAIAFMKMSGYTADYIGLFFNIDRSTVFRILARVYERDHRRHGPTVAVRQPVSA